MQILHLLETFHKSKSIQELNNLFFSPLSADTRQLDWKLMEEKH